MRNKMKRFYVFLKKKIGQFCKLVIFPEHLTPFSLKSALFLHANIFL